MPKKRNIAVSETKLTLDTQRSVAGELFAPCTKPWEAIYALKYSIREIGESLHYDEYDEIADGVFVHISAYISHSAKITAPAIICGGARLCHFSHVSGSVIGAFATVGDGSCVSSSILFDKVSIGSLSCVRSSILGYRTSVGSHVTLSDARADRSTVEFQLPEGVYPTERLHIGSLICDRASLGDGSVICPGSVIAESASVSPMTLVDGFVGYTCLKNSTCSSSGPRTKAT